MSLADNIAPLPPSGAGRRTIVIVALILLGLTASFPPSEPAATPLPSAAIAPWNTTGGALAPADGQKPNLRPAHSAPFLTVQPDPAHRVDLRLLISCRQTWSLTPALYGLTLPARVQADL